MLVTEIWDTDPDGGEGLLARVIKPALGGTPEPGVTFYGSTDNPQQVGVIRKLAGETVPPHAHHYVRRTFDRTQETLLVVSGLARVTVYTSAGKVVRKVELWPGELVCFVAGGHGIEFSADTTLVEIKTGPYSGKDRDKYPLEVNRGSV